MRRTIDIARMAPPVPPPGMTVPLVVALVCGASLLVSASALISVISMSVRMSGGL